MSMVEDVNRLARAGAEGRLQERADARRHQGDFQKIVEGINETLDALVDPIKNIAKAVEALGRNDVGVTLEGDFRGDFLAVKNAFDAAMAGINNTLYRIVDSVEQVGISADQLNSASQNMASVSEEQAAAVQEVTSSVTETNTQVQANTENANSANQLVISASQAANQGQAKMEDMNEAMNAISASAQSIGKIIKVIDEIAFQTNLLALNAAVEAARAGQHGRGFAVVAQEVRNLAGRSAKAARETAEMIEDSVKRVNEGVAIAKETREALDQIVTNVVRVKDLVAEIAVASAEQSRGISQINVAMNQVSKASQEGSQQAEELAASSSELSKLAESMSESVRRFKLRERASAGALGLPGLNGMTAEMVEQLKALLGNQQRADVAAPAKVAAAGGRPRKNASAIIPLDQDERGFGGF
ncbi:methyl-accepting chemotaxis protein [Methylocystis sp. IM4]